MAQVLIIKVGDFKLNEKKILECPTLATTTQLNTVIRYRFHKKKKKNEIYISLSSHISLLAFKKNHLYTTLNEINAS